MKLSTLLLVTLAFFCSLIVSASIPYSDMSDDQVARLYVSKVSEIDTQNNIEYPPANTTWYVGESVNVTFKDTASANETVAIFFFNQSPLLAGGPLTTKVFPFVVPQEAVSPENGTSLLLAVRRKNYYLQTVDSVVVRVLPARS
ncbi:hypothetical protein EDC96DRAFT_475463 [Choanephora cucurbitarum]|nr:hypothetical protein EDC96DRAFT_475463 [Choanephora cucurbitarum]